MKSKIFKGVILALICIITVGCGSGNGNGNNKDKTESKKVEFDSKDLDGEKVDSSIFKDYDLTMINIWATYCGPCIEEMPRLQEMYTELKDKNVNLIGIVADIEDQDNINTAKQILEASNAEFTNIVPDDKLTDSIFKGLQGVPTTIFVDSEGNIVGEEILGAVSKEQYMNAVDKRLESMKETAENKEE